ncbi:DUF6587 family protein [Pseudoduganella violaceinigra]|uniref:DUF6587 family protein n=1 Tax=Pseudoduganella violaceinigra TaxID=246602 RepID=UPI00042302CD|nr:DUF6587 family protein [Pseudoduganella violaceinigra]
MWQEIIVGIVVAAAALHAARKYLPAAWRQQIVFALSRRGLPQDKLARFFNTESSCGSGCGSCGGCGDSSAALAPPSDGGPARRVIKIYSSSNA